MKNEQINNPITRVLRGGSWFINPRDCRLARRNWNGPVLRYSDCGFRMVRQIKPPEVKKEKS